MDILTSINHEIEDIVFSIPIKGGCCLRCNKELRIVRDTQKLMVIS